MTAPGYLQDADWQDAEGAECWDELPLWFEWASLSALAVLLVVDLFVVGRRPHVPSMRESALWVGFYVALALAFGAIVGAVGGAAPAGD